MKKSALILTVAFLGGCVSTEPNVPFATGGSKSDGMVEMTFNKGVFGSSEVDWLSSDTDAKNRCVRWGYTNAERFDGMKSKCTQADGYGTCYNTQYTITYQCY